MPLPDERPRQSVANLIGKFETHSKHLSPSQSNPSRSSSVVSQLTSDLNKEESKEKREWPPKTVVEMTTPTPHRVMPTRINPDARKEPAVQTEAEAPPTLQYKKQQAQNPFLENWRKGLPRPTEMEPEPPTPKPADEPSAPPAPVQKVVPAPQPPKTPTMKTSAPKIPASTSSRSLAKTPMPPKSAWKSTPPKQPFTPATPPQQLKPQLTGQSMVSSTSRRTSSRAAKTPTRTESGTKTPTPRSKTPSSGLFAPTAASLAKSRNAPLPPPPSIKKTSISSDAMDRLSRPTAASLSRVKSGPTSPVLTPKSPPRISSVKSKSTTSPSKSPQTKVNKDSATSQSAIGVAAAALDLVVEPAPELPTPEFTTNGHPADDVPVTDVPTTPEVEQTHLEVDDISGNVVEPEVINEGPSPSQTSEAPEIEPEIYNFTNGVEPGSKTNLEDIVNLLETVPVARLSTEEISEIPDEDDN